MKFAQLVVGPAGCGKSTYCKIMQDHCETIGRSCKVINMDPAAEHFEYNCYLDVCDLVTVPDVMSEMNYGPNGGLIVAMEFILGRTDLLDEYWDQIGEDDFVILDCPGQIELYTHMTLMRDLVKHMENLDFRVIAVYCVDVSFITDPEKFISGSLSALACMVQLETPHVNVLTKCDLAGKSVEKFLDMGPQEILSVINSRSPKHTELNQAMCQLLDEWSLVSFLPLNREDEDSIMMLLAAVDHILQWDENAEPKDNFDMGNEGGMGDDMIE